MLRMRTPLPPPGQGGSAFRSVGSHPREVTVSAGANPTYQLSHGLAALYAGIDSARDIADKAEEAFEWAERPDGSLMFTSRVPMLQARYRFVQPLGRGRFSQLVRALDTFHPHGRHVAIKVMHRPFSHIGRAESVALATLNAGDPWDSSAVIRQLNRFYFGPYFCLVLELMDTTLEHELALARETHTDGSVLPVPRIRTVAAALLTALAYVRRHELIHADVKPENVLLAPAAGGGVNVKLCDFGNSIDASTLPAYLDGFELQSLRYRAPEVLLGVPFGAAVDVWSVGCIVAELHTGTPLFACNSKESLLAAMVRALGPVPSRLARQGKFYTHFFDAQGRLRFHSHDAALSSEPAPSALAQQRTHDLLGLAVRTTDTRLLSFLMGLLDYDPACRAAPLDALAHPFLAGAFPACLLPPTPRASWTPTPAQLALLADAVAPLAPALTLTSPEQPVSAAMLREWLTPLAAHPLPGWGSALAPWDAPWPAPPDAERKRVHAEAFPDSWLTPLAAADAPLQKRVRVPRDAEPRRSARVRSAPRPYWLPVDAEPQPPG